MEAVEGNSGQMSPYALVTDRTNLIEYCATNGSSDFVDFT